MSDELLAKIGEASEQAVAEAEASWRELGSDVVGMFVVVPVSRELHESWDDEKRQELSGLAGRAVADALSGKGDTA